METVKISVKEYAERNKTSVQSVYKRINKGTLRTITEKINGRDVLFVLLADNAGQAPAEVEKVEKDLNQFNPNSTPSGSGHGGDQPRRLEDLNPAEVELNPAEVEKVEQVEKDLNPFSTPPESQSLIKFLQDQLMEKDRQIAKLQEQTKRQAEENREKDQIIKEQLQKLNDLLRNSQILQAQSNSLLLEKNNTSTEEEQQEEIAPIITAEQDQQKPKKKRGWLYRFFFDEE